MTKIPHDDILGGLYKLRIRESEKLKTVLELYELEIHQKKDVPDYHRLKTMVQRSIEQEIRNKNLGARNGNYERNAVVNNQGTEQRGQIIIEECWQWKTDGQCSRGDSCSFRHDINKRAKLTQPNLSPSSFMRQNDRTRSPRGKSPSGRMSRWPCKEYLKGTCINSYCEKWHPPECIFYKTKSGCRFVEKCSYAHRQVDEQPTKRSKKNDDKSAVAPMATPGILLRIRRCRLNDQTTILVTWHQRAPVILLRTATESSNADSDSLRQEVQRVRAEQNAATTANDAHWRQQGEHALHCQQTGFMDAARQYEQAAHDRTTVPNLGATAQTQMDMVQESFRNEQLAENQVANQKNLTFPAR